MELCKIANREPARFVRIVSCAQQAAGGLADIVQHDVVRVVTNRARSRKALVNGYESAHLDDQAGLFQQLPRNAVGDGFPETQLAAGNRPSALGRMRAAAH